MKRMKPAELEALALVVAAAGKALASVVVFACRAVRADDGPRLSDELDSMNKWIDDLAGIAAALVESIDS